MQTVNVDLAGAIKVIKQRKTTGLWFGVSCVKKDGKLRKFCARGKVKKGVKGVGLNFDPNSKGLLGIWDAFVRDFRFINLNGVTEVRTKGIRYVVK